ncbi:MAG: hypothetical protein RL698_1449 [Pseudomonadota bacterium]
MRRIGREAAVAIATASLVAALLLRPLPWLAGAMPRYVGATASMDNADRNLNAWILAWTARAATRDPRSLFDGNVYFPARNVLAGSETMLAQLPVTAPVSRLGGDAAAVLFAQVAWGFVGTALAVYLLARLVGAAPWAAALAAAAVALEPGRINRLGLGDGLAAQPQYLGFQWAPLAMAAAALLVRGHRGLGFAGVVAGLALQALACFYLGYYAFLGVPLWSAVLWWTASPRASRAHALGAVVVAVALAGGLVLPVALRYLAARRDGVLRPQDPELVHLGSLAAVGPAGGAAWIGPLALLLAAAGLVASLVQWRSSRAGARAPTRPGGDADALAGAAAAAWSVVALATALALGPEVRMGGLRVTLPHAWLAAIVPGFGVLRAPIRALSFATLGLAVGGALALSRAGSAWPSRRRLLVAAAGIALAMVWIGRHRVPVEVSPLDRALPPVYRWLASQPRDGGLLEVPGAVAEEDLGGLVREARYMLFSTVHWQPIVNGYTGYPPVWGELAKSLAHRLPSRDALQTLVDLAPVRRVILHRGALGEAAGRWEAGAPAAGLVEVARFDDDVVYEVTLTPLSDWRGAVDAPAGATTLEGASLGPLDAPCARGSLAASFPTEMRIALGARAVPVKVVNGGDCTWPGLAVRPDGLVVVRADWPDLPTATTAPVLRSRLPHDLAPGAPAELDAFVLPPRAVGTHRLRLVLAQEGAARPIATVESDVRILPARPREPLVTPSAAAQGASTAAAPGDAGAIE